MNAKKRLFFLTESLCLLPILVSVYFETKLPNQVAVDAASNTTIPKLVFILAFPVMMAVLQAGLFSYVVKKKESVFNHLMLWLVPVLSMVLHTAFTNIALRTSIGNRVYVTVIATIISIILGYYLVRDVPRQTAKSIVLKTLGLLFIVEGFVLMFSLLLSPIVSMVCLGIFIVAIGYILFADR